MSIFFHFPYLTANNSGKTASSVPAVGSKRTRQEDVEQIFAKKPKTASVPLRLSQDSNPSTRWIELPRLTALKPLSITAAPQPGLRSLPEIASLTAEVQPLSTKLSNAVDTDTDTWDRLFKLFENNEYEACRQLEDQPLHNRELKEFLLQICHFRKYKNFIPVKLPSINHRGEFQTAETINRGGPLFIQISEIITNRLPVPSAIRNLLNGPEAFAAAFFNANLFEYGLKLHRLTIIPEDYPNWYISMLTNAIHRIKGSTAALRFAFRQHSCPISLIDTALGGMLSPERENIALSFLTPHQSQGTKEGHRAVELMVQIYLLQKNFVEAKNCVETNAKLAASFRERMLKDIRKEKIKSINLFLKN